jgi:hypothetical protein
LRQLILNPLIIACILGFTIAALGGFPPRVKPTIQTLGRASVALGLLCVGAALSWESFTDRVPTQALTGVLKLVGMPAITYGLGTFAGLPPLPLAAAVIFMALPTAGHFLCHGARHGRRCQADGRNHHHRAYRFHPDAAFLGHAGFGADGHRRRAGAFPYQRYLRVLTGKIQPMMRFFLVLCALYAAGAVAPAAPPSAAQDAVPVPARNGALRNAPAPPWVARQETTSAFGRALQWTGRQLEGAGQWTARQGEKSGPSGAANAPAARPAPLNGLHPVPVA